MFMLGKPMLAYRLSQLTCSIVSVLQVNVPSDTVQCILDNVALGQVNRGLFHEATLAIFAGLIYFWKK